MKGKTVIITGASSGIGRATATSLANMGANLLLVSDNEDALKQTSESISRLTGNRQIEYYVADLTSQKAIINLANEIKNNHGSIDVLINNAGAVFSKFEVSADGLEKTIAINHFAPYILTIVLLELLKNAKSARIINVASHSHFDGRIDLGSFTIARETKFKKIASDFFKARFSLKLLYLFLGYFFMESYAQSKLANVMFTIDFAEKLKDTNITVNCLHPGLVNTQIGNKHPKWYARIFWNLISGIVGISAEEGAATSIYLAQAPEVATITGKYFEKCQQLNVAPLASNALLRKQVMDETRRIAGL
jgi:NAD(P)-dependent dehydrogenase (short-subunit alcohol dehydrogenase family)